MPKMTIALAFAAACLAWFAPTSAVAMYHPGQGRWMQREPGGYLDGMSLYQYVKSRPAFYVDPTGWQATQPEERPTVEEIERWVSDGWEPFTDAAGKTVGFYRTGQINCLGFASGLGKRTGICTGMVLSKFIGAMGFGCHRLTDNATCECANSTDARMVVWLYQINPANKADGTPRVPWDEPWVEKVVRFAGNRPTEEQGDDYHAAVADCGRGRAHWREVPGAMSATAMLTWQDETPLTTTVGGRPTTLTVRTPAAGPASGGQPVSEQQVYANYPGTPRYCCCKAKAQAATGPGGP
jgi:hypothetical protein